LSQASAGNGPIGLLGGTFDPIHFGHLRAALELLEALALDEVAFVPCREPPHREPPQRSAQFRLELVRAAIAEEPRFRVDDRELGRARPSYTVDTLASFREEFPRRSVCLLLGMDAFVSLPSWHRWTELVDYAHIVVAHRPGWMPPRDGELGELIERCGTSDPQALHSAPSGAVFVTGITQLEISSTALRAMLARGGDPRYLMPDTVREIVLHGSAYR